MKLFGSSLPRKKRVSKWDSFLQPWRKNGWWNSSLCSEISRRCIHLKSIRCIVSRQLFFAFLNITIWIIFYNRKKPTTKGRLFPEIIKFSKRKNMLDHFVWWSRDCTILYIHYFTSFLSVFPAFFKFLHKILLQLQNKTFLSPQKRKIISLSIL